MRTKAEITHAFTPNTKLSVAQKQILLNLQVAFIDFATMIQSEVPECADRTSALRKLLEAKFMCSQAVTHQASPESGLIKTPPQKESKEEKVNVESQT